MTETNQHTVSGLIAKRAEIAGQIEHLQHQLRELVVALDHVDATIHLFNPDIELDDIKSRLVPERHRGFRGEITKIVLTTLRNAKKPLTSADIAQRVMAERGLDTSNKRLLKLISRRTASCLRSHRQKGTVRSEPGPGQFKLWTIVSPTAQSADQQ